MADFFADILSFTQIIGFIAMGCSILRYQMKTNYQMRLVNVFSAGFYALHFFMLQAWSGAFITLIASIRSALLLNDKIWEYKRYAMIAGVLICAAFTFYIYDHWSDLLPLCAILCGTLMDVQDKAYRARIFGALMQCSWLIFAAVVGSYGTFISSAVNMGSNLIGFWRHQLHPYLKTKDKSYFDI